MKERLDKYVSVNGMLTRSEAKKAINKGRVTVNESICRNADAKVSEGDAVELDGKKLTACGLVYIMVNKPAGILSATEDGRNRTILDLLKENQEFSELSVKTDLFPIGRLDKDTEGLIVLTNDGPLCHKLLSPSKHVEKEYYAECDGQISDDAVSKFKAGLPVGEDYTALPAKLEILENTNTFCKLLITLTEGKFHQVKRMCHEVGAEVTYLKRVRFGKLVLPEDLKPGEMRRIEGEDI